MAAHSSILTSEIPRGAWRANSSWSHKESDTTDYAHTHTSKAFTKSTRKCTLSHIRLFVTLWTVARQALLSMGFSRQEYWSGLPFPPPGDLPDPGIEPWSPSLQTDSSLSEPPGKLSIFCNLLFFCFGFWVISSVWSYSVSIEFFFFTIFLFFRNLCSWFWIFYFMDFFLSHLYWHSSWHIPLCKF